MGHSNIAFASRDTLWDSQYWTSNALSLLGLLGQDTRTVVGKVELIFACALHTISVFFYLIIFNVRPLVQSVRIVSMHAYARMCMSPVL